MERKNTIVGILKILAMCAVLNLCVMAGGQAGAKSQKKAAAEKVMQVNINTASLEGLQVLPRVGPATAARIVAFRTEHKGFKKVEELMNVKGIGPKTFARLKPLVTL